MILYRLVDINANKYFFDIIQKTKNWNNMKNALFDELKDLKKDMAQNEKQENEKRISEIRDKKEDNLKDEFLEFTKNCGINKIDN
jgi:hypothetical protein